MLQATVHLQCEAQVLKHLSMVHGLNFENNGFRVIQMKLVYKVNVCFFCCVLCLSRAQYHYTVHKAKSV